MNKLCFAAFMGTLAISLPVGATVIEQVGDGAGSRSVPIDPSAPTWVMPEAGTVLYDNGPLVTCEGCGVDGADVSTLQFESLGLTILGFGHQQANNNRVADDFTIPTGETWDVGTVTFFAYQSFAGNVSTITAVNLQIWDGVPGDANSNVIFGDTTTNRLSSTTWTGIYRTAESDIGTNSDRAIMANVVDVNTSLENGTYWLDWQTDGTAASGPWAPPVTILGQAATGNGRQEQDGAPWIELVDGPGPYPQGLPFIIAESDGCILAVDLDQDDVHPGDALDLSVRLHHLRPQTVTVPFAISIQNDAGEVIVSRETGPRTFHYGDSLQIERALDVPLGIAPGSYWLIVSTNEMTQGQVQARIPIEISAP